MRRFFKRFQRRGLSDVKSQRISLRMHFTHFFALSKTMQNMLNLVQVLQKRMIAMIQLKFFTRTRRFLNENKNEGIKIFENKKKKKKIIVTSLSKI